MPRHLTTSVIEFGISDSYSYLVSDPGKNIPINSQATPRKTTTFILVTIIMVMTDFFLFSCVGKAGRVRCTNGCGRSYKNNSSLNAHLYYECGVSPRFTCEYCEKVFKHKSHLKRHVVCLHRVINQD